MKKNMINDWCRTATEKIRFWPDREAVYDELKQHLLDKQEELREQGIAEDQIEEMSVAAMGSAEAIAPQLAAIHKPFWGYAYRVTQLVLVLLALVLCPFLFMQLRSVSFDPPNFSPVFQEKTIYLHTTPGTQVQAGDYTVTLTQARLSQMYEGNLINDSALMPSLSFQLRVQHPALYSASEALHYVWAEDSLGNVYCSHAAMNPIPVVSAVPYIYVGVPDRYGFAYYYTVSIFHLQAPDAQWIDLHYDRDGTQFSIRIDLTGGDAA